MGSRGRHTSSSGHVTISLTTIDEELNDWPPPLDEQFSITLYESVIAMGHVTSVVYSVSLAHNTAVSSYSVALPFSVTLHERI